MKYLGVLIFAVHALCTDPTKFGTKPRPMSVLPKKGRLAKFENWVQGFGSKKKADKNFKQWMNKHEQKESIEMLPMPESVQKEVVNRPSTGIRSNKIGGFRSDKKTAEAVKQLYVEANDDLKQEDLFEDPDYAEDAEDAPLLSKRTRSTGGIKRKLRSFHPLKWISKRLKKTTKLPAEKKSKSVRYADKPEEPIKDHRDTLLSRKKRTSSGRHNRLETIAEEPEDFFEDRDYVEDAPSQQMERAFGDAELPATKKSKSVRFADKPEEIELQNLAKQDSSLSSVEVKPKREKPPLPDKPPGLSLRKSQNEGLSLRQSQNEEPKSPPRKPMRLTESELLALPKIAEDPDDAPAGSELQAGG